MAQDSGSNPGIAVPFLERQYLRKNIHAIFGRTGRHGGPITSGMDRWMSLQQGLPILYGVEWNGQMEHPGLAASHTLEIRPTPKWTDGCLSSRDFPYSTSTLYGMDRWNILGWQLPILQKMKDFHVFSSGKNEEGGLVPRKLIEKLTALIVRYKIICTIKLSLECMCVTQ